MKYATSSAPCDNCILRYVNRQEAARKLGISVRTLNRLAKNGPTFPPVRRIGRHPRWFLRDLLAWMEQRPD